MAVYNSDRDALDADRVDATWSSLDLLVYSPVISAGVSFMPRDPSGAPAAHFHAAVAFFANSRHCPSVYTCLQMLFRVRTLIDGNMRVFVSERYLDADAAAKLPLTHIDARAKLNSSACRDLWVSPISVPVQDTWIGGAYAYDTSRLSFYIFAGIVIAENRSARFFTDILRRTLIEDYGVPCSIETAPTAARVRIPKAVPDVPWSEIDVPANDAEFRALLTIPYPTSAQRAAMRLFTLYRLEWDVPFGKVDERFYHEFAEPRDAAEKAAMFKRWCAFAGNTLAHNAAVRGAEVDAILACSDTNAAAARAFQRARNAGLLLYAQSILESALAPEALAGLKRMEPVTVPFEALLGAARRFEDGLAPLQKRLFRKVFELRRSSKLEPSDLCVAKQLVFRALGGSVNRLNPNRGHEGFDQLLIGVAWIADVDRVYGPRARI
jgi:hypothetical protein